MEVAATAEKRVVTALKTRVEGPMAASWTMLQHLPMQRVSMRDMKGSASGRTSVGSAKAMSAWIEGRASSSAASCKALSAGHVCGGVGKGGVDCTNMRICTQSSDTVGPEAVTVHSLRWQLCTWHSATESRNRCDRTANVPGDGYSYRLARVILCELLDAMTDTGECEAGKVAIPTRRCPKRGES